MRHWIDSRSCRFSIDAGQGILHRLDHFVVAHGCPRGHVEDQLNFSYGKSLSYFHYQVAFRGPDPVLNAEEFFISAVGSTVLSPVLTDYENDIVGLRAFDCLYKFFDIEGFDGPVV